MLKIFKMRLSAKPFVRRFRMFKDFIEGVDFHKVSSPQSLGLGENYANKGSPSNAKDIDRVFQSLNITADDAILDIGCAKGYALKCFLKQKFAKIHGIELSKDLAVIAQDNFERIGDKRVKVFHENAVNFQCFGEYGYLYMYNPFRRRELLEAVADSIARQCTKRTTIIYNNPFSHEVFLSHGFILKETFRNEWGREIFILMREKDHSIE